MNLIFYVVLAALLAGGGWQLLVWWDETRDKRKKYRDATTYAESLGKLFLVAGGPWGTKPFRYWLKIPAHGNGDVCLDIEPNAIRNHLCGVVADVTQIPFSNKSFGAAFASHILEHLRTTEEARKALNELVRVADGIFIVSPSRQSIAAWLQPGHHLWVWQKNNVIFLKQRGESKKVGEFALPKTTPR